MHNATSNSVRIPIIGSDAGMEFNNPLTQSITVRYQCTTVTLSPLPAASPVTKNADRKDSLVPDDWFSSLYAQEPNWSAEEEALDGFPHDQYQSNGSETTIVYYEDKPHTMGTAWSEADKPAHLSTYTLKISPLHGKTADQLSTEITEQFDVLARWTDNSGQLYCRCFPSESPWLDDDSYVAAYAAEWLPVISRRLHNIGVEKFDLRFDLYA